MPPPAYRAKFDDQLRTIFFGLLYGGAVITPVIMSDVLKRMSKNAGFTLCVTLILLAMSIAVWQRARRNRRRRQGLVARLEAAGFQMVPLPLPPGDERLAELTGLGERLQLREFLPGLEWLAVETRGGIRAVAFEHRFWSSDGKSSSCITNIACAWPAGHPDLGNPVLAGGARFLLARPGWFNWISRPRPTDPPQPPPPPGLAGSLPDWTLAGDGSVAGRFVTPAVWAELARSPRQEAWVLGDGWVACGFNEDLDPENFALFLARARRMVGGRSEGPAT